MTGAPDTRRIALICEVLDPPFDEGIRICAARLAAALAPRHSLLLLSRRSGSLEGLAVHGVLGNRWFVSAALASLLRGFDPDGILYVAWTSLTARTLARVGALRRYAPRARVGVMALQPRPAGLLARAAAMLAAPDIVMTAGPAAAAQARRLGLRVARVSPGVDASRFRPAAPAERHALRARRGIGAADFAVLHVGHLKASRNVRVLARLARLRGVRCLLAAGTSTSQEERTAAALRAAGVALVTRYEAGIEDLYRAAVA